ncbi:MAG: helix-turn-helix domain-containing protein [Fimbriimonadales bacterium]
MRVPAREHVLRRRLAEAVLRERTRLRWSQERAAEEAGLNPRHLQKIESGTVNVTLRTLTRLSAAFGVDTKRLFEP